jgi:hypothetical protein
LLALTVAYIAAVNNNQQIKRMNMKISDMNYPLHLALQNSIEEAERFISKAVEAQKVLVSNSYAWGGTKETASAKRASMDLTRSLVYVRKPTS